MGESCADVIDDRSEARRLSRRRVILCTLFGASSRRRSHVKVQPALLSIAAVIVAAMLGADSPGAEEIIAPLSPQVLQEIARVEAEIDRIEAQTLERLAAPPDNQVQQIELLGKLLLYDKQLSVNRNEACAFCHMPEAGFTGPVSELNRITAALSIKARMGLAGVA